MLVVYHDKLNPVDYRTISLECFDCIQVKPVREKWWRLPYGYRVAACKSNFFHRESATIFTFTSCNSVDCALALARDIAEQWNKGVPTFDLYLWISSWNPLLGKSVVRECNPENY